jgi:hypothetical protein
MALRASGCLPVAMAPVTLQVTDLAATERLSHALDRAVSVNTFDARQLTHLADQHGSTGRCIESAGRLILQLSAVNANRLAAIPGTWISRRTTLARSH